MAPRSLLLLVVCVALSSVSALHYDGGESQLNQDHFLSNPQSAVTVSTETSDSPFENLFIAFLDHFTSAQVCSSYAYNNMHTCLAGTLKQLYEAKEQLNIFSFDWGVICRPAIGGRFCVIEAACSGCTYTAANEIETQMKNSLKDEALLKYCQPYLDSYPYLNQNRCTYVPLSAATLAVAFGFIVLLFGSCWFCCLKKKRLTRSVVGHSKGAFAYQNMA